MQVIISSNDSSGLGLKRHIESVERSSNETFRLATDSEKAAATRCPCKKAGKLGTPKRNRFEKLRWRAKRGSCYYSISTIGVCGYIDTGTKPDNIRFNLGNYYQTEEQAQAAFEDVKLVYAKNL